jgi:hypothetical protein
MSTARTVRAAPPGRYRPTGKETRSKVHRNATLLTDVERRQAEHRLLQELFNEATALYWQRRAQDFERARPRAGEYMGRASAEELAEADARCAAVAEACRSRAKVSRFADDGELIEMVLREWSE